MWRFVLLVLLTVVSLYAQTGIAQDPYGVRVPSAMTLEKGHLYISGGFESISDGRPLAMDESQTKTTSIGGDFHLAYGLLNILELGLTLPLYYEGEIPQTDFDGLGLGDIQASAKISIPLNMPIHLGIQGDIFGPTGAKSLGFRPRHLWFLNEKGESYAYTADAFAFAISGFLTFDFFDALYWNNFGSYVTALNDNNDVLILGSGLNFFPHKLISVIAEFSGEFRTSAPSLLKRFWNEQVRFSPGIRLHLPQSTDVLVAADIGINFFHTQKKEDGISVTRKNKDEELTYTIPSSPKFSYILAITKTLNFSNTDTDHDGIPDRLDMCPGTFFGAIVNARGCPVDQDQDGVLNIVDDCPETPFGVSVDFVGCPLDEDNDSIPDYLDKCPGTQAGFAVDKNGCTKDSDNDGIDDNTDQCPNSLPQEAVDETGCPLDEDKDGVPNEKDKCLGTIPGRSVDEVGCPLDFDKDGVPNDIDKCPNSPAGEIVNSEGCPADQDQDGVSDARDLCPDTPKGFSVDASGCPTDHDGDGVPDALDKCPNTFKGAPVDTTGCPTDSDNDGIADYLDKCPETFPNTLVNKDGCPYNPKLNLNSIAQKIKFKGNTDKLYNSSYSALNDIVELMRRYDFEIEIQYSTNDENAEETALTRVSTIIEFLVYKGIPKEKLKTTATGRTLPQDEKYRLWNKDGLRLIPTINKK